MPRDRRSPYPIVGSPWWAIDLTAGYVAIFDAEDASLIERGGATLRTSMPGHPYVVTNVGGAELYLHRVIMGAEGRRQFVDHINGDGLDCRRANMRVCTAFQNQGNRQRPRIEGGTSSFKGVSRPPRCIRWWARIARQSLGYFSTEVEAARAYDKAARERWGEFALVNFSDAA